MSGLNEKLERFGEITILRAEHSDLKPAEFFIESSREIDTPYFLFLNTFDDINDKEKLLEMCKILEDKNIAGVYTDNYYNHKYVPHPMFNRKFFAKNFVINTPILLRSEIKNINLDPNINCLINYTLILSLDNLFHYGEPVFKYKSDSFIDDTELEYVKSKTKYNAHQGG